jgi:hypothetical protein
MSPQATTSFATPAWLLRGIMNTPGVLVWRHGRLSFTSDEGVIFDEPLTPASEVSFPWWYFGGGFKVTAGGRRHRVSLTRPNGAPSPAAAYDLVGLELASAARSLADVAAGRSAGAAWRQVLGG